MMTRGVIVFDCVRRAVDSVLGMLMWPRVDDFWYWADGLEADPPWRRANPYVDPIDFD